MSTLDTRLPGQGTLLRDKPNVLCRCRPCLSDPYKNGQQCHADQTPPSPHGSRPSITTTPEAPNRGQARSVTAPMELFHDGQREVCENRWAPAPRYYLAPNQRRTGKIDRHTNTYALQHCPETFRYEPSTRTAQSSMIYDDHSFSNPRCFLFR